MARDPLKLKQFSTPAPGARSSVDLPIGNIVYDLHLILTTTAGALMTVAQMRNWVKNIKILINGKTVQTFSQSDFLFKMNGTNGATFAVVDGHIRIYFGEWWRRTYQGEEYGGLGTGDMTSFVLEIEWDAAAVAPAVIGWVSVDTKNRSVFALPIKKVREFQFTPAGAGVFQFDKLPLGPDIYYQRIHFFSALVTAGTLTLDRKAKFEAVPLSVIAERFRNRGMVLQANTFTMAFDDTQQLTDQTATFYQDANGKYMGKIQDFRIDIQASGAGVVPVSVEEWSYLEV